MFLRKKSEIFYDILTFEIGLYQRTKEHYEQHHSLPNPVHIVYASTFVLFKHGYMQSIFIKIIFCLFISDNLYYL